MKKALILSLSILMTVVAMSQPMQIMTTKDYGLKGPVKRVSYLYKRVTNNEKHFSTFSLEFDKKGRLTKDMFGGEYVYDAWGRLVMAQGTQYFYDIQGRLIMEQKLDTNATDGSKTMVHNSEYNYDKKGRLKSCTYSVMLTGEGKRVSSVTTYEYDKEGRLIGAKRVRPDKEVVSSYEVLYGADGKPRNYLYYNSSIMVYDENGNVDKEASLAHRDTIKYSPRGSYIVNHGLLSYPGPTAYERPRNYTKFDRYGNGIYWKEKQVSKAYGNSDSDKGVDVKGDDGDVEEDRFREIEYYGDYTVNASLPQNKVLYAGEVNKVFITVDGAPNLWIDAEDAVMGDTTGMEEDEILYCRVWNTPEDGIGHFYITPDRGWYSTVSIPIFSVENRKNNENEKKTQIGEQTFLVLPSPQMSFVKSDGNKVPNEIALIDLSVLCGVACSYGYDAPSFMRDPEVMQKVSIVKGSEVQDFYCKGMSWTPEILEAIKNMKPSYILDNITLTMPDGRVFKRQCSAVIAQINQPVLLFSGHQDGDFITKKELKKNADVKAVYLSETGEVVKLNVTSFKFNVQLCGKFDAESENGGLTQEMMSRIEEASSGMKIYFYDVEVEMPNGASHKIKAEYYLK